MATRAVDHLLVGGGIASATCAAELRALGAGGSILVVGRETDDPYHRPPITKGYLRGAETRADALVHAPCWWRDNDVELLTGTAVVDLDPQARRARLADGSEVRFGQALLATGANARRPELPAGVHHLRTLDDADGLGAAERVVLIGGSYIACEVAASLTAIGRHCTIVMRGAEPFATTFGRTAGAFLRDVLEAHGVSVVSGDARAAASAADVVVAGVGASPETALARAAGLAVGATGGVRCDAYLRSSHPAVFCAGDVCEYDSVVHGRPLRVEHENAAVEQGRTAARNMLGEQRVHSAVPYSSCELADWASFEYVGPAGNWDEELVRGCVDSGAFTRWYLDGGCVVGALIVGRPADLDPACALIAARTYLGDRRHLLKDPDADLALVAY